MSTSEFFWQIAIDLVPLMIPILAIGVTFSVVKELIYDSSRGGR